MRPKKIPPTRPDNNTIRRWMLQYFYDRNKNSTSMRGKKGAAVKISDVKKELKALHGLTQQEVQANLTYLLSEKWIEDVPEEKRISGPKGTVFPSSTSYYRITSAGMDKIDGSGEFTMPKFHGININATGQSIITVGDGTQINAQFGDLGQALADLQKAITQSDVPEAEKLAYAADIETIQSQLAKPSPIKAIVASAWSAVKGAAAINGCTALVAKVGGLIAPFL